MVSTSLRIDDNTLDRIKAYKEDNESLDSTLNCLLDRLLAFDEEHEELEESINEVTLEKEPENKIVIIKYDTDNDLLTNWFMNHPNQDVNRYTSLELEVLERDIRSGRK